MMATQMLARKVNIPLGLRRNAMEPAELARQEHRVSRDILGAPADVEGADVLIVDVDARVLEEALEVVQGQADALLGLHGLDAVGVVHPAVEEEDA